MRLMKIQVKSKLHSIGLQIEIKINESLQNLFNTKHSLKWPTTVLYKMTTLIFGRQHGANALILHEKKGEMRLAHFSNLSWEFTKNSLICHFAMERCF